MDALAALGACAEGYGAAVLQPFLPRVWDDLRGALLAPAAPDLAPEDKASVRHSPCSCLRVCMRCTAPV